MKKLISWLFQVSPIDVYGYRYWRKISDGPFTGTHYTPAAVMKGWIKLEVRYEDGDASISIPIRKFYRLFTLV